MAEVDGEIEKEDGVLVLRRVHARYRLVAEAAQRETAERVHAMHHDHCPVYRSLRPAIDITTSLEIIA